MCLTLGQRSWTRYESHSFKLRYHELYESHHCKLRYHGLYEAQSCKLRVLGIFHWRINWTFCSIYYRRLEGCIYTEIMRHCRLESVKFEDVGTFLEMYFLTWHLLKN